MKISIIMPVYNEEKTIGKIIEEVQKAEMHPYEKEIIIVNDASKDSTLDIVKKYAIIYDNIKVISHEKNLGKGAGIRTALSHATGDLVIMQDADMEYSPEDIVKLIDFKRKIGCDVVYGSRAKNKLNKYSYFSYYWGNYLLNKITNILYRTKLTDMETCYKLIPADIFKSLRLKANDFSIEPEITAKLARKGYKIGEYPISYYPRSLKEGKKIKWRDGLIALKTLIRLRFFKG